MHEIGTLQEFIAAYPNAEMVDRVNTWERWYSGEDCEEAEQAWFCEDILGNPDHYDYQRPDDDDDFWCAAD